MTRRITSDSQDVGLITINGNKKKVNTLVKFKRLKYLKLIYGEKAKTFCEISTVDLSYVVTIKYTVEISQNVWSSQNI